MRSEARTSTLVPGLRHVWGWIILALVAAVLLGLRAFGVGDSDPDLLYLGLAFWAAHFAFGLGIPWPGKH